MQKALFLSLDSASYFPPESFQIVIEILIYNETWVIQFAYLFQCTIITVVSLLMIGMLQMY